MLIFTAECLTRLLRALEFQLPERAIQHDPEGALRELFLISLPVSAEQCPHRFDQSEEDVGDPLGRSPLVPVVLIPPGRVRVFGLAPTSIVNAVNCCWRVGKGLSYTRLS